MPLLVPPELERLISFLDDALAAGGSEEEKEKEKGAEAEASATVGAAAEGEGEQGWGVGGAHQRSREPAAHCAPARAGSWADWR